jgi:hypothetical protein
MTEAHILSGRHKLYVYASKPSRRGVRLDRQPFLAAALTVGVEAEDCWRPSTYFCVEYSAYNRFHSNTGPPE